MRWDRRGKMAIRLAMKTDAALCIRSDIWLLLYPGGKGHMNRLEGV